MEKIKVAELFAGVGGFRIGLSNASKKFDVVWSNQWEPSTKGQEASEVYIKRFGEKNHSNVDIAKVPVEEIPEHNLLVGGFPCQDYSVAKSLSQSKGITGKKGVLWWEIHRILKDINHRPEFILLENVDRLLSSPASQRGRDFAIILASLSDLGYAIEWRIINAADYGFPQRRRRVFIMGYHKDSPIYNKIKKYSLKEWALNQGILARGFKIPKNKISFPNILKIEGNLIEISNNFNKNETFSPFQNCGFMLNREFFTAKVFPDYNGKITNLGDILLPEKHVPEEFFVNGEYEKWEYLKGAKSEKRYNKSRDFYYNYAEGSMVFPDPLDKPSRTIVTGEGGSTPSRFKHVVKTENGRWRRLTPLELERLNMFPDNHTEGCTDIKRAFFMGNALVTGVVKQIGESLINQLKD
ncbi:MAG: DNA (cytosine-5-)-methyltransferase [archaeon GW2011_AR19]|nr:MAG: DNA (cytosine-5-)-methyltransferase [archaeon GW2011_AR19]